MSILDKLACSLHRNDEVPNQELAVQIVRSNDKKGVKELVDNLSNKSRAIQNDCIKVLYEIGARKPGLLVDFAKDFIALLENKNNRLQWGAMTALSTITLEDPAMIYKSLSIIMDACKKGTVITKDNAVNILIKLCSVKQYSAAAFSLLIEQLISCPTNQLPMYAEKAMPVITSKNKGLFVKTLSARLEDIEKETKRNRVEKVIKKISKV